MSLKQQLGAAGGSAGPGIGGAAPAGPRGTASGGEPGGGRQAGHPRKKVEPGASVLSRCGFPSLPCGFRAAPSRPAGSAVEVRAPCLRAAVRKVFIVFFRFFCSEPCSLYREERAVSLLIFLKEETRREGTSRQGPMQMSLAAELLERAGRGPAVSLGPAVTRLRPASGSPGPPA